MQTPPTAAAQKLLEQVTARYGHLDSFVGALRRALDHPTDRLPRIDTAAPAVSLPDDHPAQRSAEPQPPTRPGRHALRDQTA